MSEAASRSAVSSTVALTAAVRLLSAASAVPVALAVGDRTGGLAALGIGVAVAAAQLAARDAPGPRTAVLAVDVLAAVAVLDLAGPGRVALLHSLGTAGTAAAVLGLPGVLAGLGIGLVAAVLTAWFPAGAEPLPLAAAAGLPASYVLVAVLIGVVRRLLLEEAALRERLAAESDRAARAEERGRLSRDLHDSTAATLAGIRLSAEGLHAVLAGRGGAGAALALAGELRHAADRALLEARAVVADLRVVAGGDPLHVAVHRTLATWQGRPGERAAAVTLDLRPVPEPDDAARAAVLAALRESLLNVDRHAGARQVTVRLRAGRAGAVLTVADDGRGFRAPADLAELAGRGHFGLVGTAERLACVGARLHLASRPGGGTLLAVELPTAARPRAVPA